MTVLPDRGEEDSGPSVQGIRKTARGIKWEEKQDRNATKRFPDTRDKGNDVGRRRVNHPTAWFGIWAFLLATLGSADGKVLCIGDDGHIALEAADSYASHRNLTISAMYDYPSGERQTAGVASCCTHCGPCTDFPALSMDMLRHLASCSPGVHSVHLFPIAPVAPASLTNLASREAIPYAARRGSRPDPTAVSLRNTVLLI